MFENIEALVNKIHQDIRFNQNQKYDYAKAVTNVPLTFTEIVQAGRYYPIVFTNDNPLPVALLSLNNGKNRYVNDNGSWNVPYIPAHFRRYPFIFAKAEEKGAPKEQEKYIICIDKNAPHFKTDQGVPLFTENGDFSDFTQKMAEFLKHYQQEIGVTANLMKVIEEKEILVNKQFNFEQDGQQKSVGGFRTVDIEKMNKLDDAVLADWVRKGIMSFIHAHLNSLANIRLLFPIGKK